MQKKAIGEKKRLLIYAHYYVPDVASTGQILRELAEGMLDKFEITVVCVVPSYGGIIEEEYKAKRFYKENINGVEVFRIRVSEFTKANKISRIKNILGYFFGAAWVTFKVGPQDYVFSISQPPILGGLIGVWGKWVKRAKYIYNIQDFNPEQIVAVNYSKNKLLIKILMWFDKFSCKQSDLIITVGRDLVENLKKRFHGKKIPRSILINNWINEEEIYPLSLNNRGVLAFREKYNLVDKFVIMYSGNIGLYYDLENLIKIIQKFKPGTKTAEGQDVIFAFIGGGTILDKLMEYKEKNYMDNVIFIPYQDKEKLIYSLNAGDVHWVVNAKGIKGVSCPSKFYGVAAAGRPVLGVLEAESEIRCLIEETECGLVCEPGDYKSVEKNIQWFIDNANSEKMLAMGERAREYLVKNLTKEVSIKKYQEAILEK